MMSKNAAIEFPQTSTGSLPAERNIRYHHGRRPFEEPLLVIPRALAKLHSLWISRTYPFASIGRGLTAHWSAKISRQRSPRIAIGNDVKLGERTWLNPATEDPNGEPTIVIEDGCYIAADSILSGRNRVHLETKVMVGQHVIIQDHNHAYEDIDVPIIDQGITEGGTIRIGEGSWIGCGAAILCSRGELSIGRHCVISANSVVIQSIPDYSVAFGVPAKIIRQYDPGARAWSIGQLKNRGTSDVDKQ
jgi:acetyltransferase-like isoleucine patch superfamily enzyme